MSEGAFFGRRSSADAKGLQDLYETPPHATQAIIDVVINQLPNKDLLVFYDCACGNNAVVNVFLSNNLHAIGTDLYTQVNKVDYLTDDIPYYDFLITNPPFSDSTKFLKKAYESGKPFLLLLNLLHLGRKAKYLLFQQYGVIIYCVFPSPRFLHNGKNVHIEESAWFYGNSGSVGAGQIVVTHCGHLKELN